MMQTVAFRLDHEKFAYRLHDINGVRAVGLFEPDSTHFFVGVIAEDVSTRLHDAVSAIVLDFAEANPETDVLMDVIDEEHAGELLYADQVVYV